MTHQSNNLISVIIPVFNAEKFLQTSIESVINQTYRNIEIILINDGSSDESAKICDNYSDQDSRIKVFHKSNAGPAAARNLGIEIASGGLIFFIDADFFAKRASFGRQYPPTPKPGNIIFECVGLIFIAFITLNKSILSKLAYLTHSSIKAIFEERKEFSKIFAVSHSVMEFIFVKGNFL